MVSFLKTALADGAYNINLPYRTICMVNKFIVDGRLCEIS